MASTMLFGTAHAAVDVALRLETSLGNNSNLLNIPDVDPIAAPNSLEGGSKTSNRQMVVDAAVGIPLGSEETRLLITTQLVNDQFSRFADLNHDKQDTALQLPWRFGKLWEGNLIRSRQRTPFLYDYEYRQLDMITQDTSAAVLVLKATPTFSFPLVAVAQSIRHEDVLAHAQFDEDRTRIGAGVRYKSADGNEIQVGQDRFHSKFIHRNANQVALLDDGYHDTSTYMDVLWNYSVKTRVALRLATRQRHHSGVPERDNSAATTRLILTHLLSSKTRLDLQLYNQPADSTSNDTLYSVVKGANFTAGWAYSPQTKVIFQAVRESRTAVVNPNAQTAPADNPTTLKVGVKLQHTLTRGVSVYIDAARERVARTRTGSAHQTALRVGVDYSFENIAGAQARTRAPTLP